MSEAADFEALLRQALAPVEPPDDLALRLEETLVNLTELAADELEGWELRTMHDPRNWVRPVAAVAVGAAAGTALVLVRARRRQARRPQGPLAVTERTLRDLRGEARKLIGR